MAVGQRTIDVLAPWLEEQGPNDQNEWGMYCPFHDDSKRSASFNTERGVFYCQTCDRGATAKQLTAAIKAGEFVNDRTGVPKSPVDQKGSEPLSEARVPGWASALLANRQALREFQRRRGLDRATIESYQIGWDKGAGAYTIPVHDDQGTLLNIRRYTLDPQDDRRKMWSVANHGTPVLYPLEGHEHWGRQVIICEGELDALFTIQQGFDCVTRTGAAKVWKPAWNHYFIGKDVYLCHDMDTPGQEGNLIVAEQLATVANAVYIVALPYEVTPKNGKDLTDYWLEGHDADDFRKLMLAAQQYEVKPEYQQEPEDVADVTVLDSFDPANMGKHLRMKVTIVGKASNNYLVPNEVLMTCSQDFGVKCKTCPMGKPEDMGRYDGEHKVIVAASDPILLEFQNSSNHQVSDLLRQRTGVPVKCPKLKADGLAFHSIDEVFVRPSVDLSSVGKVDHIKRRFTLVDQHGTMPNNTVEVVGAMFPNPRSQANEFQAWDLQSTLTNVDHFEVTEQAKRQLRRFQPREGQSPLTKATSVAHDLSQNVTHIYDRDDMHVFFDLVYHSIIQFEFLGRLEEKGWLEALIVGDTRTGKSAIAKVLTRYYGAGEFINSESASVAGILGGVQQIGREWIITWGAVPLNDRRAVVLDEISGLRLEQLSQLSGMRSSGEAQITKIVAETTPARTRAVWMGNPRDGRRMDDFTYGVQAIRPLIGNNEDIARFDMAMTVSSKEVASALINERKNENTASRRYPSSACRTLINWCWTRRAEHVKWAPGAEDAVLAAAVVLGNTYREDPPLIQAANVRLKLARIAVALAARTVSTDKNFEHVIVRKQHVADAVAFLDRIYGNPFFGYKELSEEAVRDRHKAKKQTTQVETYLRGKPGLSKFLRESEGHFRRQDMEDMLNWTRDEANLTINALYEARMIRRNQANIHINPELHQLVREIEE